MLSLTTTRDGLAARRTTAFWLAPLCLALAAGLLYSINLGRLPQPHAPGDLAHALQPHRDLPRVLLFDMGEPLLERGGTCGRHAKDSRSSCGMPAIGAGGAGRAGKGQ